VAALVGLDGRGHQAAALMFLVGERSGGTQPFDMLCNTCKKLIFGPLFLFAGGADTMGRYSKEADATKTAKVSFYDRRQHVGFVEQKNRLQIYI